jgi:transposase-like protein
MPSRENCTLKELQTAAKAAPIHRPNLRLLCIKALAMGIPHEQVAGLFGVNEDSVSRWVRRFNERGIDGLAEGPRSGRPPKITKDRTAEYRELILHPERANGSQDSMPRPKNSSLID